MTLAKPLPRLADKQSVWAGAFFTGGAMDLAGWTFLTTRAHSGKIADRTFVVEQSQQQIACIAKVLFCHRCVSDGVLNRRLDSRLNYDKLAECVEAYQISPDSNRSNPEVH
jgi:hypothetical protein